jgi:hypothetical protein
MLAGVVMIETSQGKECSRERDVNRARLQRKSNEGDLNTYIQQSD